MPTRSTPRTPPTPTETERRMRALLDELERKGGTLAAFARLRGIPRGRLGWWRWELRRRESGRPRLREGRAPSLLPVEVTGCSEPPPGTADLVIELRCGRRIYVSRGVDLCFLQSLVQVLEESC